MFKKQVLILESDFGILKREGNAFNPLENSFYTTYNNLINEWNKNLFVPYPLLQDIINTILNSNFKYRNIDKI